MIAIRGYKTTKTKKNAHHTDVTASDALNKKVLLRSIEPSGNEYVDITDVKNMKEFIKRENYDSAILISKRFTEGAVSDMAQEKIQRVSDDYMPPFETGQLYAAIFNCINDRCKGECGKVPSAKSDCKKNKDPEVCETMAVADNARYHFNQGWIGLLKNDLKLALALNK